MRHIWAVAVVLSLSLGFCSLASRVPIDWSDIAPLSLPRHSGAIVVADGLIYILGGIEYGNKIAVFGQSYDITTGTLVNVYNPSTNVWSSLSPIPYPVDLMARRAEGRQWPGAAVHDGRIYLFGGASLNGEVRDTIDVYDITTDTWTAGIARLPKPAVGLSAATFEDKIYLFGGAASVDVFSPQDYFDTCYVFDPSTRTITEVAPMPIPRVHSTAVADASGIVVLGGVSARAAANAQRYDPGSDVWTSLESYPWERRFWGAAQVGGANVLVAGRDEHAVSSGTVDVYVPAFSAWIEGDPIDSPREDAFVIAVDGVLFVIGGRTHDGIPLDRAERGIPDLEHATYSPPTEEAPETVITWTEGTPMPTPRYFGTTAVLDDVIYTIGGLEEAGTGRVVEAYDPVTDTWTPKASLPEGRFNLSSAVLGGMIYVFGGALPNGEVVDTVYAYDPVSDAWILATHLPHPAAGLAATVFEEDIYLFGGSQSSQMFVPKESYYRDSYAFNPSSLGFTALPPMPIARNMAFAGVLGDEIFVIGGMKSPGATANQRYSPRTQQWQIQAEMPNPCGGHTGVVIQSLPTSAIFILGGANRIDVYGYDGVADRWYRATSIPAPRNMSFTAVSGSADTIYMIGGLDEHGTIMNTVYRGTVVGTGTT